MLHQNAAIFALTLLAFAAARPALAQEDRLDYRQDTSLKDAVYYVNEAEGLVTAMEKASGDWKAGDPAVSIADVNGVLSARDKCATYLTYASNRLKLLPAEHSRVAPALKRFDAVKARLVAVEAKVAEIHKKLDAVVKQGDAPEYKVAFDRLREISGQYANADVFRNLTVEQAEVAKQLGAAKAERQRIAAKYDAMLKQPTSQAQQMNGVLAHSDEMLTAYEKALAGYLATAPAAMEAEADEVMALAKEGVANKKTGYFGEYGGVTGNMRRAEKNLNALATLAPDAEPTKRAAEKVRATRAAIEQLAATFAQGVIASNRLPDDSFSGADREALLKLLTDKWAKEGNGAAILKVGVIGPQWNRQTKWEWHDAASAWEKVDKSRTQGYLVAKLNDTQAAVWPVNFVKDHLSSDSIGAYFLYDVNADPGVNSRVLLTNVK